MARPAGKKNADFEAKAKAQLSALSQAWLALGPGASLRELCERAELSPTNVRHYWGDREALVRAMLEHLESEGRPHMERAVLTRGKDAESTLRLFLHDVAGAWVRFGVGRIHGVTLAEGLGVSGEAASGPAYVQHILEPTLQTLERLLQRLVQEGQLPPLDARVAGLALLGPLVLALLHQDNLGGAQCRPLDLPSFLDAHLSGWLRGYAIG